MNTGNPEVRPLTLLIAALGGEGGGVLTSWIVNAARAADLPVQATSIPGVAQRTGATTYYIEIWPQPWSELAGEAPVLALLPAIGEIDVLAATELLEAGRAIRSGFVTPERTLLIASTHRVFTTGEKMVMDDGRFDPDLVHRAIAGRTRARLLLDLATVARQSGAPINAVLLGAIAGGAGLPIAEQAFRAAILAEGKAAQDNLRGFEAGLATVRGQANQPEEPAPAPVRVGRKVKVDSLLARVAAEYTGPARPVIELGVRRLADFQDAAYAGLYLERLASFSGAPPELLAAVARHLAVRMSFEDAIRVAQAKTRPGRLARIRAEAGAAPRDLVVVTEFLNPGFAELRDLLPESLARGLLALGRRWPGLTRFRRPMHLRTTTLWGYGRLRMLAGMRRWRRASWRFRREQEAIAVWLALVERGAARDVRLGLEIAECARLIKGYGETHQRGTENFLRIEQALMLPALTEDRHPGRAAEAIAEARRAALADPAGATLAGVLREPPPATTP